MVRSYSHIVNLKINISKYSPYIHQYDSWQNCKHGLYFFIIFIIIYIPLNAQGSSGTIYCLLMTKNMQLISWRKKRTSLFSSCKEFKNELWKQNRDVLSHKPSKSLVLWSFCMTEAFHVNSTYNEIPRAIIRKSKLVQLPQLRVTANRFQVSIIACKRIIFQDYAATAEHKLPKLLASGQATAEHPTSAKIIRKDDAFEARKTKNWR